MLILVFGESENDTGFLQELIPALCESKINAIFKKLRKPVILSKSAAKDKKEKMLKLINTCAKEHEKSGRKVVVVAHCDADAIEPSHEEIASSLEADLRTVGVRHPIAAVAAWCVESWWFHFPKEVARVRSCWAPLPAIPYDVGQIVDAKKELKRQLRPQSNSRCPDYRESDSIKIASYVRESGKASAPNKLRSKSLDRLRRRVNEEIGSIIY